MRRTLRRVFLSPSAIMLVLEAIALLEAHPLAAIVLVFEATALGALGVIVIARGADLRRRDSCINARQIAAVGLHSLS
jgi:hypothetical protein